jgi:hypothetical protein
VQKYGATLRLQFDCLWMSDMNDALCPVKFTCARHLAMKTWYSDVSPLDRIKIIDEHAIARAVASWISASTNAHLRTTL